MPGVNAFFPVAALQVTVETPHGCGSFTSTGPNLSLISPETPTSLWINKYHHKEWGKREGKISFVNFANLIEG